MAAISTSWPCAIPDDIVVTPFPHPLYEYELGLVQAHEDRSISSIWQVATPSPLPQFSESTFYSCRLRSLAILDRASKLSYLDPEPGWEQKFRETQSTSPPSDPPTNSPPAWTNDWINSDRYNAIFGDSLNTSQPGQSGQPGQSSAFGSRIGSGNGPASNGQSPASMSQSGGGGGGTGKGWMRTARIKTPKAYEEVKVALERLEADLTPDYRTDWAHWDGKAPAWHNSKAN